MVKNKDRFRALPIKERAKLINKYVSGGVMDLKEMRRHYNSFDEGEDSNNFNISDQGLYKRLAYLIGSDMKVAQQGHASIEDIKRILSEDNPQYEIDDNKLMYIFGNIAGLPPVESTNGKDFSNYLKQTYPLKYYTGKIKEYQGVINPFNEYVIDERDKVLFEELAKKGKDIYSNADTEHGPLQDFYDYRDDVASYNMQLVNTPNGIAISASDLYDFGPDYNAEKYAKAPIKDKLLLKTEAALMSSAGNPFILRQDNIPVRFVNVLDEKGNFNNNEDTFRAISFKNAIDKELLSKKDIKEGKTTDQKIAEILDTGYIEPAVVTAEYKHGGRILDGTETEQTTTGLPVGAGLATYNHPKYNHAEEAEMYSYLRSRGVPHIQASAIMGNIAVESMLNPEITQIGGGGGYGLIQATDKARKNAFINYDGQPYEFGSNITPETQRQLDYIIDKGLNTQTRGEWRGNHNISRASVARRKFLEATDVNKASKIFTENYLRPGKPHTKRRKSMSNYFNDNYGITERALEEFENSFLFQNN